MTAEVLGVVLLRGELWTGEDGDKMILWEITEKDELTVEGFRRWFAINRKDTVYIDVTILTKNERWIWSHRFGWRRALSPKEIMKLKKNCV